MNDTANGNRAAAVTPPTGTDTRRPYALVRSDGGIESVSESFLALYGREALAAARLRESLEDTTVNRLWVSTRSGQRVLDIFRIPGLDRVMLIGTESDTAEELETLRHRVAELERVSVTDRLTGAWNRRHLETVAESEINRAARQRQSVCMLLFDIDHFKSVNDRYGHATGDLVLIELVSRLKGVLRPTDTLYRWGGEEFVVLAPTCGKRSGGRLAQRLQSVITQTAFPDVGKVTASVGVAQYLAGESLNEWFQRADRALYAAKTAGRNRVIIDELGGSGLIGMGPGGGILELHWHDEYESGDPLIDAEHRELFSLVNALLKITLADDTPHLQRLDALDGLIAHIEQHFAHEERILAAVGYPDLDAHRKLHNALLARARVLRGQMNGSDSEVGSLVEFLALDVVSRHILKADRDYFPFVNGEAPQDRS